MTNREILLTASSIALTIDLALLARRVFNIYFGHRSTQWPHVVGRITGTRMWTWYDTPSFHEARVTYEYEARGRQYQGSRVIFGRYMSYLAGTAQSVVRHFEKSDQVKVFHHPKEPAFSVLVPGVLAQHYAKTIGLLVLGLLLIRAIVALLQR